MTTRQPTTWYSGLDDRRVTLLRGIDADDVASELDPLPDNAPALAAVRVDAIESQAVVVAKVLGILEDAVRQIFPAWLPGGDQLEGYGRLDLMAARKLSFDLASNSEHFGPFVSAMAESALLFQAIRTHFIDRTRAEGLRRLLAETYHRRSVALVISVGPGHSPIQVSQLVAACEWLANDGGFSVWITGPLDHGLDRIRTIDVQLPARACGGPSTDAQRLVRIPALAGSPHPGSAAEKKLERALTTCDWATGREWNQPFQSSPLHERIVVDLRWPAELCVVEIDGDEHRHPVKFARDRQRDVVLQLDGYAVLRFTNAQIIDDVAAVVSAIERYIKNKRDTMSRVAQNIEGAPRGE